MSAYPPPGPLGVRGRIDEAIERIELELRHVVAYVNDEVVPQVRSESIAALRTTADSLRKFVDSLEHSSGQQPPQPPRPPNP
jgi:bisphosphoglycerate-dependent phosphoglycerate mutase